MKVSKKGEQLLLCFQLLKTLFFVKKYMIAVWVAIKYSIQS